MSNNYIILAIESSCDETAISIVKSSGSKVELLCDEISSQVKLHAKWGGVVPNLAAREHVKNITPLLEISLEKAGITPNEIDAIAVTQGPGLIPALMVGVNFAKTLSFLWEKPLIGIHHIEGHIYSNFVREISNPKSQIPNKTQNAKSEISKEKQEILFPALVLVVSGGHTQLVFMKDHFEYEIIGQTLDDAVGEAFDKVARILGIGYPGGPRVAQWASKFQDTKNKFQTISNEQKHTSDQLLVTSDYNLNKNALNIYGIKFPRPMINKQGYNFSFSGLKTAVLYETKKNPELLKSKEYVAEICHEFQQASIDVLVSKTIKAAEQYYPATIMLAGGVSANKELRKQLGEAVSKFLPDTKYKIPDTSLTGDNAAMIATAASFRWQKISETQRKKMMSNWKNLQPDANLKLNKN